MQTRDEQEPNFNVYRKVTWTSYEACSVIANNKVEALELAKADVAKWEPSSPSAGIPERESEQILDAEEI